MSTGRRSHYEVLGVRVDAMTIDQSLDVIAGWVAHPTDVSRVVIKPYVEFVSAAHVDSQLRELLNRADLSLADGISIQWAASYLYGKPSTRPGLGKLFMSLFVWLQKPNWRDQIIPERFAGINHTKPLLGRAETEGWRVGVIGGSDPGHTAASLRERWPKLNLGGTWSGFTPSTQSADYSNWHQDTRFSAIVKEIRAAKLDVLLVGMGFSRQECFMDSMRSEDVATVMIGEGGSFDYAELGGKRSRAPMLMRKIGLEWLWRLLLQPSRILRQLAIPKYIWAVHTAAKHEYRAHLQEKL